MCMIQQCRIVYHAEMHIAVPLPYKVFTERNNSGNALYDEV